jgi:hypothetical protein
MRSRQFDVRHMEQLIPSVSLTNQQVLNEARETNNAIRHCTPPMLCQLI